MIRKVRLEAEGEVLQEVMDELAASLRHVAKISPVRDKDGNLHGEPLHIHDQHYEMVNEKLFKGRIVLGVGPKPRPGANVSGVGNSLTFTSGGAA